MENRITGVMIYYYFVCKRKLWYFCHEIRMDEYSCAVTPQVRQTGNRLSGLAGTAYASLLT